MTKPINQNIFQTPDLGCAAGLISAGFTLKDLNRSNPKKIQFYFVHEAGIEEASADYFADRLQVNSRTYFDNVRNLKNLIHAA